MIRWSQEFITEQWKKRILLMDITSINQFDNSAIYDILSENISAYPELILDANNDSF